LAVPEADRQCFPFLESLRSELIKDEEWRLKVNNSVIFYVVWAQRCWFEINWREWAYKEGPEA
jgi:hypothetical protein